MPKQTFFNLDTAKQEAILSAALEEFSAHSFREASVNTIVQKAQISKGSLYQYFEDKKDLYLYLIECAGRVKLDHLQSYAPIGFDDFYEGFSALMIHGAKFTLENPIYGRLLYRAFQGPLVDDSLARLKALNREYLTQLLQEAMEKGEVRNDAAMEVMVFFLGVLTTEFAQFVTENDEKQLDGFYGKEDAVQQLNIPEAVRELVKLIKTGLAPEKK